MSPEPTADRESLQVVTNSDVDFANFVMHVSFGADWRKLFDFVGFFARKGRGFFEADAKDSPFLTLPHFPDPGDLPLGSAVNSRGLPLNVRGPPAPAVRSLPPPPATHARRHVSAHTHTRVHTHTHRNVRTHVSAHTHTRDVGTEMYEDDVVWPNNTLRCPVHVPSTHESPHGSMPIYLVFVCLGGTLRLLCRGTLFAARG